MSNASSLRAKFEQEAANSAVSQRSSSAAQWDNTPALPSAKNASGQPSASGLKARFEHLANPPPPKKQMGSVKWQGFEDQGKKVRKVGGYDPTKPPPPKSLSDLP
eukprot:TRINITY_DN105229_c0_g1_i1.p1 TRINITY_DN105229_c0_g1~~TRINITY_DN105229_c0_g1_i1.p1  ORF type:complete len:105 (+),score=37.50 TRINITY_DN105229_c0_g1_i1:14-328(+)